MNRMRPSDLQHQEGIFFASNVMLRDLGEMDIFCGSLQKRRQLAQVLLNAVVRQFT